MTNVKLTSNETALLTAFAFCQMNATNGSPKYAPSPSELATYVWLEDRNVNGLSIASKKGVLSSLVKKGLVTVSKDEEGDYLNFTQLGFDTVMELIKTEETEEKSEVKTDIKTETPASLEVTKTVTTYRIPRIAERFNTEEQFNFFRTSNINFTKVENAYDFNVSDEQIEDLVKAIRDSKIFSRFTAEKLVRYLVK
ncbi:hypothetical protein EVB55_008 [Rhizobium phage RHph_Y68]|uniref:Uncharacterized protein n=1 Tax=Rhizobium phage RHph_Y68 TaxID=2509787 RepID=A0A7S5UUB2_9CAUD|nr:hypothetical protein PP934_gp008 [Rhizobium phage RHph_Y68]QIG67943.1 hypothetical protein EVB55_008 [Rhizobium phage RHph_Y68]